MFSTEHLQPSISTQEVARTGNNANICCRHISLLVAGSNTASNFFHRPPKHWEADTSHHCWFRNIYTLSLKPKRTMTLSQFMSTLALSGDSLSYEIVVDRARIPASSTKCSPLLRRTFSLPTRSDPNARWGNLGDGAATSVPSPASKARTVNRRDSPASPVSSTEFEPNEGIDYSNCEIVVDRATIAPPRRAISLPTTSSKESTTADARWGLGSPTPKLNARTATTTPSPRNRKRVNSISSSDEEPVPASIDQSPDQPRRAIMVEPSSSTAAPLMKGNTTDPNDHGQKLVDMIRMLSVRAAMTITKQSRHASLETVLECTTNTLHSCNDVTTTSTTTPMTNVERWKVLVASHTCCVGFVALCVVVPSFQGMKKCEIFWTCVQIISNLAIWHNAGKGEILSATVCWISYCCLPIPIVTY